MADAVPFARRAAAPFAALLLVAGCATGPSGIDVTRFHLGAPIARGTIVVEPANPALAGGLEFQTYAAQLAEGLRGIGFSPVGSLLPAEYVAAMSYGQTQQLSGRSGPQSSVGFGIGGGSFGRSGGVGLSTGVQVPVGGGGSNVVNVNVLSVQIKRRSDQTMIWEGKAVSQAPSGTSLGTAMPGLINALLRDFPGPAGQTVNYRP